MKKMCLLLFAILVIASCTERSTVEEPVDKFNGYAKYLKCGEKTSDLKDKNNNKVGVVKTGIDNDANFYVTYDCSSSGKKLDKSNCFAGNKKDMPINKPNDPREDRFPNSKDHGDNECTYTYKIPLCQLPPADEPGFVHSAHCTVKDNNGHCDDAWADGNNHFHDNGCGDYDEDYEEPTNKFTILYGTAYTNDTLKLFHIDVTNGTTTMILKEFVGNSSGSYDGTAYNDASGIFLFANYNTGELWVNQLKDPAPSFSAGTLTGIAASATFSGNAYYYVNEDLNTINKVTFTSAWAIASETVLDTIPSSIRVNDIAMNPAGDVLYMLGEVNGGGRELISWNVTTETFYSMAITVTSGAQIAFGSDGVLYAIAPITEGGSHSLTYIVNTSSGTLTPIEDDVIIIDDPFSDISSGPTM
jgi:hypothetical protein